MKVYDHYDTCPLYVSNHRSPDSCTCEPRWEREDEDLLDRIENLVKADLESMSDGELETLSEGFKPDVYTNDETED